MKTIMDVLYLIFKELFIWLNKTRKLSNERESNSATTQTTTDLYPLQSSYKDETINKWGCYFLSLVYMSLLIKKARDGKGISFDTNEIELMFKGTSSKYLNHANSFVKDPNGILEELGVKGDVKFIDRVTPYSMISIFDSTYLLVCRYVYKEHSHFVLCDYKGKLIFDSLGNSLVRAKGKIVDVRAYKISSLSLSRDISRLVKR